MKRSAKITALLLAIVLALAVFCSCTPAKNPENPSSSSGTGDPAQSSATKTLWDDATYTEDHAFGSGSKTVQVEVKVDSHSVTFTLHTDAEKLGEALLAENLIAGEESAYGLYVKTVNGMLADYDTDKTYWAFYKNGEYMSVGVDAAVIADGEHYELVLAK